MRGRHSRAVCGTILRNGVSYLALCVAAAGSAAAQAQVADDPVDPATASPQPTKAENSSAQKSDDEIVVVGVRRALATSQIIKRNADTVVDSITATDIGAFPDKSASEALSRVPGITVNRLQSADDSTHPSGEPTSVLIRGLPFVRTEFNGRDSFSADSARGLNFNDVSPELLAGIDSYKNQTAEMIEGGLAGTVNLRTRLPFDSKGLEVAGTFKYNYGDRSGRWTPEFSLLGSYTFDTDIGRFGILADYAQSHVVTRTESVIMDKIDTYCTAGFGTAQAGNVLTDGSVGCTANPFGGSGWAYAPDGIRFSEVDYDRNRRGIAVATQYENNAGNLRVTAQYTNSHYKNAWLERASHVILDGNYFGTPAFNPRTGSILGPADGTPALVFGPDGMLQSGTLTRPHGDWRGSWDPTPTEAINTGSAVPGVPFVNNCGFPTVCSTLRDGLYFQDEARNFAHKEGTRDYSANIAWDVSDRLHTNFDVQHIDASTYNNDILVAAGSIANMQYSVNGDGTPQVTMLPGSNVNYAPGGLANPHNYWIPFIQGHVEKNNANELALRGDARYEFEDNGGWLDDLSVGVRDATRKQTVRYSTFNWTPIAANWNCNGPGFNADNTTPGPYPACAAGHPDFKGYGAGIWESHDLGNFYNGSVFPNGELVYLNRDTLLNYDALIAALSGANTNSPLGSGYTGICDRPEATVDDCFTPSEVMKLKERTTAAYAMLRFGGDDTTIGGVSVKGNIGLRVARTRETSEGAVAFPTATNLLALPACGTPLSGTAVVNPRCFLSPAVIAFASGGGTPNIYKASFTDWLPSFNVRFGLDKKNFIRFAYSRAISRPDIGLLRNYVSINSPIINTGPDSPYIVWTSATAPHTAANVAGYNFVFMGEAGNAGLKPMKADQFDLTYERYMSETSSFTINAFYKKLSNTVTYGLFNREFTNNGSTQVVQVRGPQNEKSGGKLYGFEAAFQTFFDFLPSPLDGLGTQLNYTFVKQSGINNSNLLNATSGGGVGAVGIGVPVAGGVLIDSHNLQGISKHTINAVALYEKGPIGVRLAYNWRSRYLTNNLDCCIGLPVFQKSAGYLDGSIRFSINRHIELSLDASNLLNVTTVYQQEVFGDSTATPGAKPVYIDSAWNRVDRRYQFGVRAKF
jgi:TonB-dependent receptor